MSYRELKLTCRCQVEALHLCQFEDDPDFYVSRWTWAGYVGPQPWRHRIRHIWRIVRKGTPYEDDIILSPKDAQTLGRFLLRDQNITITDTKNGAAAYSYTFIPKNATNKP